MNTMKKILVILSLFMPLMLFRACVTPYQPEGVEEMKGLLVVDGIITDNQSVIRLSKTMGLEELPTESRFVNDATVTIETSSGESFRPETIKNGEYTIPTGTLDTGKEYRINIEYNGDQYQSPFQTPLSTPAIDSIYYRKEPVNSRSNVQVLVATHDNLNDYAYYRWSYVEEWEYRAPIFAEIDTVPRASGKAPRKYVEYELGTPNNRYYCWGKKSPDHLIVASTTKLASNVIKDQVIQQKPASDERWALVYRIRVTQNRIRKEAYEYFSALQNNIEDAGSIFAPMPSKMEGNITCINDPEKIAIGYMEVSTTTTKERFIPSSVYEPSYSPLCEDKTVSESYAREYSLITTYKPYMFDDYGLPLWAPGECVDCTYSGERTKERPDNWPTDNY